MEQDDMTYDAIIRRAKGHLSRLNIGDTFDWRSLLGEDTWSQVTAEQRAQTVGNQLARHFSQNRNPVIEFDHTKRSPLYSVWRKIREVGERG